MARSRLVAEVRAWCFTKREVRIKSLWAFQRYKCTGHPARLSFTSPHKDEGMEEMMGGFDQTHGKDLQEQVSARSSWMSESAEKSTESRYPEPMLLHIEPSKKKKGSLCRGEDKKLRAHVDASLSSSIDMQNKVLLLEENLFKMLEEIKLSGQGKEILMKLEMLQKLDEKVQKIDENVEKLGLVINWRILEEVKCLQDGMTTMEQQLSEGVKATNIQQTDSFERVWEEMKRLQDGMTTILQDLRGGVDAIDSQQVHLFRNLCEELKRLQGGITKTEQSLSDQKQVRLSNDVKESSSGKDRADVVLVAISSGLLACSIAMCAWTLHF